MVVQNAAWFNGVFRGPWVLTPRPRSSKTRLATPAQATH